MRGLPQSGRAWLGVILVPFKVFVPAGYLMVAIQRGVLGYRMDTGEITGFVLIGYQVSFLILVLGAMAQYRIGDRKGYFWTCGFIAGLMVSVLLLLPYLSHT